MQEITLGDGRDVSIICVVGEMSSMVETELGEV